MLHNAYIYIAIEREIHAFKINMLKVVRRCSIVLNKNKKKEMCFF